jgi:hypothetical protein
MTKSNKEIALEVLKWAFIDRDPTVVEQYFGKNYKQHHRADGGLVGSRFHTVFLSEHGSFDI